MTGDIDDWLRRAAAAQRVAMERALASLKITPAQFALLRLIGETPGLSGAEAARIERLTAPTLSVIVGNLERMGALLRRPHPNNARIQCLEATDLGRELATRATEATATLRARMAAHAPAAPRGAILNWLQAISQIEV